MKGLTVETLGFRIARGRSGRLLIGWLFAHMTFALPVRRLRETQSLVAFHHPRPSNPVHILLVPMKAIASLTELRAGDQDFIADLFPTVQGLVAEFGLETTGYRLVVNGGPYQDIAVLHFHLISGAEGAN